MKKFLPKSKGAIIRNPKNYTQVTDIYSRSDLKHHLRTQQLQETFSKKNTIQSQSIDQNLQKIAATAGFSNIYTQGYIGFFKDINDYIYLNRENIVRKKISSNNFFSFVDLKNEFRSFHGWPYFKSERLTFLNAKFKFFDGFLFSLLKKNLKN